MAETILIEATPLVGAGTNTAAVRLAGGGSRAYTHKGFNDWLGGVANKPRVTTEIGFDQSGWTGGAIPQTSVLRFVPTDKAVLSNLAGYFWPGARVTVSTGDDDLLAPTWAVELYGTVAAASVAEGALTLTIADLSLALNKPAAADTFRGTGGVEGGTYATGRIKRRTWGRAFNVEGFLLDQVNNIYEFGDPYRPIQGYAAVKDIGAAAPTIAVIDWQGNVTNTLNALRASVPEQGSCVAAPSINCVKWWTQPNGPLTADLLGETTSGYIETAPEIVSRILPAFSDIPLNNLAEALSWQSAPAGIHANDANETVANLLDRLLLPLSLIWVLETNGSLSLRRFTWQNPVETIDVDRVEREATLKPMRQRKLGYRRNYRQHSDSEISAALLAGDIYASDVFFADGSTVESYKPAEPNATRGAPAGTYVGTIEATQVYSQLTQSNDNAISALLRTNTFKAYVDAATFIQGQPISTVIQQEVINRTEGEQAIVGTIGLLGAKSPDGSAFILSGQNLITGTDELGNYKTLSSDLTSLGTITGDHQSQIDFLLTSLVTSDGALSKAVLRVDQDGAIAGFSLSSDGTVGAAKFLVNTFQIVNPGGGQPFTVFSIGTDGVVEIPSARVKNLAYEALVPLLGGQYNNLDDDGDGKSIQVFPGGLIIQFGKYRGSISRDQSIPITFKQPFPSKVIAVIATSYLSNTSIYADIFMQNQGNPTLTGATFYAQATDGDATPIQGFDWIAFGK